MKSSAAFTGWLLVGAFLGGCASPQTATVQPTISAEAPSKPVTFDEQAIEAANVFLHRNHAKWGPAIRVIRTGANWYRVEFTSDSRGAERVVLVNPATGEASFPLAR